MYKLYFRQALQMLKQNKFISMVSIMGTALAIAMIMTLIVVQEAKTISLAPESNRYRSLFVSFRMVSYTNSTDYSSGSIHYDMIEEILYPLETPQYVSAVSEVFMNWETKVRLEGQDENMGAIVRYTDANYWKILDFKFIKGTAFTEEDFQSGRRVAVITENTARKFFGGEDPLNKIILVDHIPYQTIAVVKDVSPIFKIGYSEVWLPITSSEQGKGNAFSAIIMASDKKDFTDIKNEVHNRLAAYNSANAPRQLMFRGPDTYEEYLNNFTGPTSGDIEEKAKSAKRKKIFMFLILLMIPAINLSGFSISRIKKRIEEIGVRKAFGAKRHVILIQVLYENLITSLIGGFIGLILSWFIAIQFRTLLFQIQSGEFIPLWSVISPVSVIAVCVICILLNLISAGFPAYRASRLNIIDSLTQNNTK